MRSHSCEAFIEKEKVLTDKLDRLDSKNTMLESEVQLSRMVLENSTEIIRIMGNFFRQSFEEIASLGLNLKALDTVKAVLLGENLFSLRSQLYHLQEIEKKLEQQIPAVFILQDFMNLLAFLHSLPDTSPQPTTALDPEIDTVVLGTHQNPRSESKQRSDNFSYLSDQLQPTHPEHKHYNQRSQLSGYSASKVTTGPTPLMMVSETDDEEPPAPKS